MMHDIHGKSIEPGALAQLLCTVLSVDEEEGVKVRIYNSEEELLVSCSHDEVLGWRVAPELLIRLEAPAMLTPEEKEG